MNDGIAIRTCSAEDLIEHKAFAGRERDWLDVEGVLARQGGVLDLQVIRDELPPLLELKGDQEAWPRLVGLCQESGISLG